MPMRAQPASPPRAHQAPGPLAAVEPLQADARPLLRLAPLARDRDADADGAGLGRRVADVDGRPQVGVRGGLAAAPAGASAKDAATRAMRTHWLMVRSSAAGAGLR